MALESIANCNSGLWKIMLVSLLEHPYGGLSATMKQA